MVRPFRIAAALVALALLGGGGGARAEPPARAHHHDSLPPRAWAADSLYQLSGTFHDEEGHPFKLASLAGKPALVVMFYGSCKTLCPLLIEQARHVELALSTEERAQLRVILVTFDPQCDTAERLRALASERKLDRPRWTLLRGDDGDVRELAMVLGVQYRRLPSGDFSHTALVTLLDRKGRVAGRLEGLTEDDAELVTRIRQILAEKHAPGASH